MQASEQLKNLLKSVEQLRLTPYLDQGGIPTIGYGNTFYENGQKVKLTDPTITAGRANQLFDNILGKFTQCVNNTIERPMTQQQLDAFVMLCYNCGMSAFSKPCKVSLYFNAGDMSMVKEWWIKSFVTANGVPSNGLVNRRKCEWDIFENGIYKKW